jgi:hypothetical protein
MGPAGASRPVPPQVVETWTPDLTAWEPDVPVWEPEARFPPEAASVMVDGREVRKGSRVLLQPGPRGDSMDMFLSGRVGLVEGVYESVDDDTYVAVTIENDPAADLHAWYGRFLYFRPGEVAPLPAEEAVR